MSDVVQLFDQGESEVEDEFTAAQRLLIDLRAKANQSLDSEVWTPEFWETMERVEKDTHAALGALWEASEDGTFCTCEVCITRTVLEAVMPTITEYVEGISQD